MDSADPRFLAAKQSLEQAIRALVEKPRGQARAWRTLGEVERGLGDREAAVRCYERTVELYRGLDDPLGLAHTVRHCGDVYIEAERWETAGPCYDEALALYRLHPEASPLDVANALRSMAVLKERSGCLAEAAALWEEAGGLYGQAGVEEGAKESERRRDRARQG